MTENEQPIFIVGPSRSGTTLLGGCITACSEAKIARETHYFDDLRTRIEEPSSTLVSNGEITRCQNYFLALSHRRYGEDGDPERGSFDRSTLRARAEELGGSADAYFEAFCRLQAEEIGKSRWGEKTPRHIFRIAQILDVFPQAKIICMIRDPRAVVASYRDFKKDAIADSPDDPGRKEALEREQARVRMSYHVIVASFIWRAVANATSRAREKFGSERIRIIRYEDLVADPPTVLDGLGEWLSLDFDLEKLRTVPIGTSSYSGVRSDAGITSDALERWKQQLSAAEIQTIQLCSGRLLSQFHYEVYTQHAPLISRLTPWISLPWAAIAALWANRSRSKGVVSYALRRARSLF